MRPAQSTALLNHLIDKGSKGDIRSNAESVIDIFEQCDAITAPQKIERREWKVTKTWETQGIWLGVRVRPETSRVEFLLKETISDDTESESAHSFSSMKAIGTKEKWVEIDKRPVSDEFAKVFINSVEILSQFSERLSNVGPDAHVTKLSESCLYIISHSFHGLYSMWDLLNDKERQLFVIIDGFETYRKKASPANSDIARIRSRDPVSEIDNQLSKTIDVIDLLSQMESPVERIIRLSKGSVRVIGANRKMPGAQALADVLSYYRFNRHRDPELLENDPPRVNVNDGTDPLLAILCMDQHIPSYSSKSVEKLGMAKSLELVKGYQDIEPSVLDAWTDLGVTDLETIKRFVSNGIDPDPTYASIPKSWENSFFGD